MTNKYQKNTPKASSEPRLAVPDEVTIAMGEIAEDMREGLLALAVGAGLQVMAALMEADVAAVCGPRGKHNPGRTAVRHGSERGSVTLGGRRVGYWGVSRFLDMLSLSERMGSCPRRDGSFHHSSRPRLCSL